MQQLTLADINIEITQKNIRNLHLRVNSPDGRVTISAPKRMNINTIREFAESKLDWIKKQQAKIKSVVRESPKCFESNENHYFNGKRYTLQVIENKATPKVVLNGNTMELYVKPESSPEKRQSIVDEWYRIQLKATIPAYIEKWERLMKVKIKEFAIKKMKTKWGTCNRKDKRIWLSLELAKKPAYCLEYVIVHELTHLLERQHNARFYALMWEFLPEWQFYKKELNKPYLSYPDF